jgi:Domain of unknown function (DUF3859)
VRKNLNTWSMRLMGVAAAFLFSFTFFGCVQDEPSVERLDVIKSGFYTAVPLWSYSAPESAGGRSRETIAHDFLERTPEKTAVVGIHFGVRFIPVSKVTDATVTLRSVWRIPEPGITNPKTGLTYVEDTAEFKAMTGSPYVRGYGFDEEWEIALGVWTLEIWQGDRMLLERNFTIQ